MICPSNFKIDQTRTCSKCQFTNLLEKTESPMDYFLIIDGPATTGRGPSAALKPTAALQGLHHQPLASQTIGASMLEID